MRSIWLKIFIALVATVIVAILSINYFLSSWLSTELELILNKDPHRKNNITFVDFTINLAQGDITIHEVNIVPVTSDSASSIASIEKLVIEGVNFTKLITKKEIVTKTLSIVRPEVNFVVEPKQKIVGDSKEINLLWKDILTRVDVKNFEIIEGFLNIHDQLHSRKQLSMSPINLEVSDIIIDTTTIDDPFPIQYNSISLSVGNLQILFDDFELTTSTFNATEKTLEVSELRLLPVKGSLRPQIITIHSQSIDISRFSWGFLDEQFYLNISTIEVAKAQIDAVKNRAAPRNNKEKPLLSGFLRNLPFQLHIDSVVVKNATVRYEQPSNEGAGNGIIYFDNFYCTAYNITNMEKALKKRNVAIVDVESDFMKSGHLKSHFKFTLDNENDIFSGNGEINSMNLAEFNAILSPLASIAISGHMNFFKFNFSGDKWNSKGKLDFDYNKLNVQIFKKENDKKNKLLSGLSKFVVNANNNFDSQNYKTGTISANKKYNKGFFSYLWDSLQSGLLEIVAPNVNTEKKSKRKTRNK